jgi:histidinol dehydrogenase
MTLRIYRFEELSGSEFRDLLKRPALFSVEDEQTVLNVIREVHSNGDRAVLQYTREFDHVELGSLEATPQEWEQGLALVSDESWNALDQAAKNIELFHIQQFPEPIEVETYPGITCRREWRSLQRVGLYAPGGSAPLVSTVLMLSIPARIAGCEEMILCTPPSAAGLLFPEMFAAAKIGGVHRIFKAGGAQAIAAMAAGTATIPKVDKIFGPGNRFVTAAKSILSHHPFNTPIDMIAGPSELLLIADNSSSPEFVAADLLTQTEHGPDSQVILVCASQDFIISVQAQLELQLSKLPRRNLAARSLSGSYALIVSSIEQAIDFANFYAPEHLMLSIKNAEQFAPLIRNAGSVFLGPRTSVVFGDYISGTNHTLPTGGSAVFRGGLTVEDFMKPVSFQSCTAAGAAALADAASKLASMEGLEAHAAAAKLRIRNEIEPVYHSRRSLNQMVRKQFPAFKPYSSARSESVDGTIFLDANELPVDRSVEDNPLQLNRYPDPYHRELRQYLADHLQVSANSVFTANGSDEVIDLLIRLFCEPARDSVAILEPTYGVYEVAAAAHGAKIIHLALNNSFSFRSADVLRAIPPSTKLLFCCSPNNPSGNLLDRNEILALASSFSGIVIVDEAYIEFSNTESLAQTAAESENIAVLRTLSKAWGHAGIRVGYCIARPELVSYLMKIKPPYNISSLSLHAALLALKEQEFFKNAVESVISERERMRSELREISIVLNVFKSDANFLMVRFKNPVLAYEELVKNGIVVRRRSEERFKDCLRITIGTNAENDLVLQALRSLE